jgi:hypothetical protein
VANPEEEETLTHRIIHTALVVTALTVALAVPAVPAVASDEPLIVPTSSTEHANHDAMIAPASSSEHGANTPRSSTALIVPASSTEHADADVMVAPASSSEHRPASTASVIAANGPATQSQDRWAAFAAVGLLLAVLVAAVMAIRVQIRGRDVAV